MDFNQRNWYNNSDTSIKSQTSSDEVQLSTIKNEPKPYKLRMIDDSHIRKLCPAFSKTFENTEINCVDFSECGDFALCSSKDFLKIYKLDENEPIEFNITTRDGFKICKFQNGFKLLHTTTKNGVNYLDFESNNYLYKYPSESSEITSLSVMKSSENHFAIASQNFVKIWDLRTRSEPIAAIKNFNSLLLVACHPLKREFAIAFANKSTSYTIEIYKNANPKYSSIKFTIENNENYTWTDLKFSDCGKMLMACTKNSVIVVLDSNDGSILHELKGFENLYNTAIDACFTPCSNYVVSGSQNSIVHFWELEFSDKACMLKNSKIGPIHRLAFNPKYMCMATAGEGKFTIWVEEL